MFDANELELIKQSSRYKLKHLPELTKEELLLKSKYEDLRKAKERLLHYKISNNCKSQTKRTAIPKTIDKVKQEEKNSRRSTELKNWSKQMQEIGVKRQYPVHSFEEDSEPRSVKISGENFTEAFFYKHFNKFGDIRKIRINEDKTNAILTFKRPSSAAKCSDILNGAVVDNIKLKVTVPRKNTSWSNVDNNSPAAAIKIKNRGKSVHLRYKGYLKHRDFEEFFQTVGTITRIYLNEMKHFGFAMFENEDQAQRAIIEMDGQFCKGIKVYVSPQKFSNMDSPKPVPQQVPYYEEREMVSYEDLDDVSAQS